MTKLIKKNTKSTGVAKAYKSCSCVCCSCAGRPSGSNKTSLKNY